MIGRKLTMKAIIIEDEKPSARRLQRMLEKLEVKIDHILHSVEDWSPGSGIINIPNLFFWMFS